ncbi:hypothetical protein BH11PLA1_BH11PLA1_15240 [soil metagenome]
MSPTGEEWSAAVAGAARPSAPVDDPQLPPRTVLRVTVQVLGFLVSLAILAWVIVKVGGDEHTRAQAERLLHAPPWQIAIVLILSGLTTACSGLVFWAVGRGLHNAGALECIHVNGVGSLLGYLPMKASLIFRVLYHRRAGQVDWLHIAAWMSATALVITCSLTPPLAASLGLKRADALWWVVAVGGSMAFAVALVTGARYFAGAPGMARLHTLARNSHIPGTERFLGLALTRKLHRALDLLGNPASVALAFAFRTLEFAAQAARFWLIAQIVGIEMSVGQAMLAGPIYFFVQATSPAGVAGPREGALLALLGEQFGAVILAVSVAQACMDVLQGILGAVCLRLDRVFLKPRSTPNPQ